MIDPTIPLENRPGALAELHVEERKPPVAWAKLADALKALPLPPDPKWPAGVWDKEVIRHGTMSVSVFAPRGQDHQTPHAQDELYFIMSGSAVLHLAGDCGGAESQHEALPGGVFFVPAQVAHRFVRISDDFASWVVFWGPAGGETSALST